MRSIRLGVFLGDTERYFPYDDVALVVAGALLVGRGGILADPAGLDHDRGANRGGAMRPRSSG